MAHSNLTNKGPPPIMGTTLHLLLRRTVIRQPFVDPEAQS